MTGQTAMIEELYRNIFRIGVPLKGNPLKEINSYYIRGESSDLLIDTGFRMQECREALEAGLRELASDPERRDLYITHMHADHSGLADQFVGPGRNIYISGTDLSFVKKWVSLSNIEKDGRFLKEGFSEEMLDELEKNSPSNIYVMKNWGLPCIRPVEDGYTLNAGEYELRVISVPGHTPGNTMLYEKTHQLMFSGDHILFDITPNITFWEGMEDSLGSYLDSLEKADRFSVKQTLPGHRKTGIFHERIRDLREHHRRRIAETFKIVCECPGRTAFEIAGRMTWKIRSSSWEDFPVVQKRFAVGECISHLDYLIKRGKVVRETYSDGKNHYRPL